jgi:hypothetical protein
MLESINNFIIILPVYTSISVHIDDKEMPQVNLKHFKDLLNSLVSVSM